MLAMISSLSWAERAFLEVAIASKSCTCHLRSCAVHANSCKLDGCVHLELGTYQRDVNWMDKDRILVRIIRKYIFCLLTSCGSQYTGHFTVKFMNNLLHVQAVDTRPSLFLREWPGVEAIAQSTGCLVSCGESDSVIHLQIGLSVFYYYNTYFMLQHCHMAPRICTLVLHFFQKHVVQLLI